MFSSLTGSMEFEQFGLTREFSEEYEELLLYKRDRVRVEFYVNEKSFKERLQLYFIKNQRSSLRIRIFNLLVKLITCVLYVIRVSMDKDPKAQTCFALNSEQRVDMSAEEYQNNTVINWAAILCVDRHDILWIIQVTMAAVSLAETLLVTYLSYKGNILQQIITFDFIIEVFTTVPFIATIADKRLRHLFIPVFLNCWLAKSALENMFNDLHRALQKVQSALSHQLTLLCATLFCVFFTSICGIEHLQRGGRVHLDLFQSFYYVIVTFSTVGYGDYVPDIWLSQLFMVIMICLTLLVLPAQLEQLVYTFMERQKQGGTYSRHRALNEKHVVVCTTYLQGDLIMDFLNEFYAHPMLQDYFVVLLSPCELDPTMRMILQVPLWAQRVIYVQGSALKDSDLTRVRMGEAEACFILAARNYSDHTVADQHTILRSWAVKDFAPDCPQYVQVFRPENKVHVKFAEHVVCEDEFKYAMLANNCVCPGISTLVTLLLHTSRGQEGQASSEEWQRLYGECSGNEIYHIRMNDSNFFGEYEGKSFTYASFHAHRKYGVALVAVQPQYAKILLNPGPQHIMKKTDICFYMSITKEENSAFILAHPNPERDNIRGMSMKLQRSMSARVQRTGNSKLSAGSAAGDGAVSMELQHTRGRSSSVVYSETPEIGGKMQLPKQSTNHLSVQIPSRRPSIAQVPAMLDPLEAIRLQFEVNNTAIEEDGNQSDYEKHNDNGSDTTDHGWHEEEHIGIPHVIPYIGTCHRECHLLNVKRWPCCLKLACPCEHFGATAANDYTWCNRAIILAADYASNGIYNFIVPLRAHFQPRKSLKPVVLLLEAQPDPAFLDAISWFPLVYWMIGSIDSLDDLLKAGINRADNVVVVNRECSNAVGEDYLADCNTIVSVQTMYKMFPSANIITELSQASNMRFMQFRAKDNYGFQLSRLEKKEKERGSHIYYMFRRPFAAGNVFSASMLDTLLYQAFVKDYLITFVRLLLGIDQASQSGYLTSMTITKDDEWIKTYGRLYQKLCSTTCEIPIGIYRTQTVATPSGSEVSLMIEEDRYRGTAAVSEREEISNLVRCRMQDLFHKCIDDEYDEMPDKKNSLSYVVINPGYDRKLEVGDIIYLIKPTSLKAASSRQTSGRDKARPRPRPADKSRQQQQQQQQQQQASGREEAGAIRQPTVPQVDDHDGGAAADEKQAANGVSGTVV